MFENPRRGRQSRLNTKIRSTMLCLSGCELYSRRVPLKTKTLFRLLVKLYNPKNTFEIKIFPEIGLQLEKTKPGPKLNSWVFNFFFPFCIPTHPKNPKIFDPILVTLLKIQPHYSHFSRENPTPSSGTSLLASCKGVPPPGQPLWSWNWPLQHNTSHMFSSPYKSPRWKDLSHNTSQILSPVFEWKHITHSKVRMTNNLSIMWSWS